MDNENTETIGIDFDALVPAELRDAVKEVEEPVQPTPVAPPAAPVQHTTPAAPPVVDDADVPITDDILSKIAEGDIEAALVQPVPTEQEELPEWVNEEEYKNLARRLSNYGADTKLIDALLKKVVDSHTINNGKILQSTRAELDKIAKEKELREVENQRLKQLERAVRFDHLPTTKEKYLQPMSTLAQSMHEVLTREGVPLSVKDIMSAKNRTELVGMINKHNLEDADITKLSNGWRQYKDLELGYNTDREAALRDLNKALSVYITEDTANKVFLNRFSDKIKNKEEYGYLADAVAKGVETNPKAAEVIDRARSNLINFIDAINKSSDVAHDENFINGLTDFMIDASHNSYIREEHKQLQQRASTLETAFKNLYKHYKQLASGAKGITGKPGHVVTNGSVASSTDTNAENFKNFLQGKIDFSELIGSDK